MMSLLLFAAGMLVKETVAALPLVIAAYELTLGREDGDASPVRWRGVLPYCGVLLVYLAARHLAMGHLHPGEMPLAVSLLSWPWLLWTYLRMLWPVGLSPSYDFPYVHHVGDARFVIPLVIAAAGAIGGRFWYRSRRCRWGLFLASWFAITLAPAFAAFCLAYADETYHDRYLYLPSVALAMAAGALLGKLCAAQTGRRRLAGWGVAAFILLLLGWATHRQLHYWESNYALFQRANAVAPHNARAAVNFAGELMRRQQYRQALAVLQPVMSDHPDSEPLLENAGFSSLALGEYDAAERYYARACQLRPQQAKLFYFLGVVRLRQKEYGPAAEALRTAVALSPKDLFYHYTLGTALAAVGDWAGAKEQYAAEVALNHPASTSLARQALSEANSRIARR
jgi:tetratricopeptide (TPR) repeat protein